MPYYKKILILSEIESGFSRIGQEVRGLLNLEDFGRGTVSARLDIFNLKPAAKGFFAMAVCSDDSEPYAVRISQGRTVFEIKNGLKIDGRLYAAVAYIDEQEIVPVLFGSNGNRDSGLLKVIDGFKQIKTPAVYATREVPHSASVNTFSTEPSALETPRAEDVIVRERLLRRETPLRESFVSLPPKVRVPEQVKRYDDTAISMVDHYPQDIEDRTVQRLKEFSQKIEKAQTSQKENPNTPPPQPQTQDYDQEPQKEKNRRSLESDAVFIKSWDDSCLNANLSEDEPQKTTESRTSEPKEQRVFGNYYLNIKDEIDKLFKECPRERVLEKNLPGTVWARVDYDDSGQYYVVGLIGEGPDYIGYGVPGSYSINPPKELEDCCVFLPSDAAFPRGKGYWMMYQDAETGASVIPDLK